MKDLDLPLGTASKMALEKLKNCDRPARLFLFAKLYSDWPHSDLYLYAPINVKPAGGRWGIGGDFDRSLWPGGRAFEFSCCPGGRDI